MSAHVYTIKLVRYIDNEYEEGDERKLRGQVTKELQEAMDKCGLPEGYFVVMSPVETIADEQVLHALHPK